MLTGLSGSLLSHYFAERMLFESFAGRLGEASCVASHRGFVRWWTGCAAQLGPASSVRAIWDVAATPLMHQLGFDVAPAAPGFDPPYATLSAGPHYIGFFVGTWDVALDSLWREAVRQAVAGRTPWVLCTNGRQLRLVNATRTYSRAYLQFELQHAAEQASTFAALWALLRADAFVPDDSGPPLIAQAIHASARHGQAVSRSLRFGVIDAVQHLLSALYVCKRLDLPALFDESLTVVYRVLFLMFAESRGLVPNWHPVYRASYTIESLRDRVEYPTVPRGVWQTLQAIARLAHSGCRAGTLVVPPFNGRLFSPDRSPAAESCVVDDASASSAVLALSTTRHGKRRVRIDYRDLGVEQLGAIYESVLEYEPAFPDSRRQQVLLRRGGGTRRSTGSFYTPQTITDYVVRRTLHPLVDGTPPERILSLRVVDPSMGSAAFLVSACRYLARAYERALIRHGQLHEGEADERQRALFRRQIAQRCLFGVDLNPTAVQLARLSLWLATLSATKPLTFLDHHLVRGNSLLGASPFDISSRAPGLAGRRPAAADLPLFSDADLAPGIARTVVERRWIAETGDDTAAVVREKEKRLDRLRVAEQWKAVADLWCACWMWPDPRTAPEPAVFAALIDRLTTGRSALAERISKPLLETACATARAHGFFHWMLEFPEAYFDEQGQPSPNSGFDAVLGNPPWDMLRTSGPERTFLRASGVYRHMAAGHLNRYQMFVERAIMLAKRGGRIGLVVPSGFATDHSSAKLRRHVLSRTDVDTITGFDNRKVIFPIHRSVRFLVFTSTAGSQTRQIACRFGIDEAAELETIPDSGDRTPNPSHRVSLTPAFLESIDPGSLSIPELRADADLPILEKIVRGIPRLDGSDGWNVRFGRELNATDDREQFHSGGRGLPVLEGKHIEPFRAHIDRSSQRILEKRAARLLDATATYMRPRLAYRDVASSTNRLSLIAAVLPSGVVTTHTLFCLKTPLAADHQAFLCAIFNSYVANYLVRQVMTTHLGSATVEALRVPKPRHDSPLFREIVELSHGLRYTHDPAHHSRLQALAARSYGLAAHEFEHVLGTFSLVDAVDRCAALEAFQRTDVLE